MKFFNWACLSANVAAVFMIASCSSPSAPVNDALPLQSTEEISIKEAEIDGVFSEFASSDSPGCAVGIINRGKLKFAKGYGMANLDWKLPITPETNFNVASVSKQFTAAIIAHAAQAGHLSLDDTLRKWVPEMPEYGRTITVRQLSITRMDCAITCL